MAGNLSDAELWGPLPTTAIEPEEQLVLVAAMGNEVLLVTGPRFVEARVMDMVAGQWRPASTPPEPIGPTAASAWTGSELLVANTTGDVLAYSPDIDHWSIVLQRASSDCLPTADLPDVEAPACTLIPRTDMTDGS